jgi:hypothetical protein
MSARRSNQTTKEALARELKVRSDQGAGVAELLEQLQKRRSRRFGRRGLTREELDELSRYCWTLQQDKPSGLLWGRAREIWGESQLRTTRLGTGSGRRAARLD